MKKLETQKTETFFSAYRQDNLRIIQEGLEKVRRAHSADSNNNGPNKKTQETSIQNEKTSDDFNFSHFYEEHCRKQLEGEEEKWLSLDDNKKRSYDPAEWVKNQPTEERVPYSDKNWMPNDDFFEKYIPSQKNTRRGGT